MLWMKILRIQSLYQVLYKYPLGLLLLKIEVFANLWHETTLLWLNHLDILAIKRF